MPILERPKRPESTSSRLWHRYRLRMQVYTVAARSLRLTNSLERGVTCRQPSQRRMNSDSSELNHAWRRTHEAVLREAKSFVQRRRIFGLTGALSVARVLKLDSMSRYHTPFKGTTHQTMVADAIDEPLDGGGAFSYSTCCHP